MPRRIIGSRAESFTLQEALDHSESCDVFVSHKADDEPLALMSQGALRAMDCVHGLMYSIRTYMAMGRG